ncbi:MAG: acyl-CoA dehydratase activase, partial [Candidatus Saganbacteria bacterium]|nr:acyl-CoA dehydratase activase [Candidatus Saganbacteria bacterium]
NVLYSLYLRTAGKPIEAVREGLRALSREFSGREPHATGVTGSGRELVGSLVGASLIKNEITSHAVAAIQTVPDVRTVIEIGGQDSKIIILRDGIVVDFAMNSICAAGTGSFLDQQSFRLGIPIEEFGDLALRSNSPTRIAGRCTVFAETDMVHKQQLGAGTQDIVAGLCLALVKNYLNNVAKGKEILPKVVFQGGVAANKGIIAAFEKELGVDIIVPKFFNVMGALGVAILAKESSEGRDSEIFRGYDIADRPLSTRGFECNSCPNMCEIIEVILDEKVGARFGGRCELWKSKN